MLTRHFALAVGLLAGCAAETDPADAFRAALPSAEALRIDVPVAAPAPDGATRSALIGVTADTFAATLAVSTAINGGLAQTRALIDAIAQTPPVVIVGEQATWALVDPASALDYRLDVTAGRTGHFDYVLGAALRGTATSVPIVTGSSDASALGESGQIAIDFDTAHALSPLEHPSTGYIAASYAWSAAGHSVTATLEGDGGEGRVPGTYSFHADASGVGQFSYATRSDVLPGAALEDIEVVTRWLPSGLGRGDIVIHGGDSPTADRTLAHECWGAAFERTFFEVVGAFAEGDAASCAFALPSYPDFFP